MATWNEKIALPMVKVWFNIMRPRSLFPERYNYVILNSIHWTFTLHACKCAERKVPFYSIATFMKSFSKEKGDKRGQIKHKTLFLLWQADQLKDASKHPQYFFFDRFTQKYIVPKIQQLPHIQEAMYATRLSIKH